MSASCRTVIRVRRLLAPVPVLLVAAACASTGRLPAQHLPGLPPGVRAEPRELTYEVEGSTAHELLRSMRARAPVADGRTWFGYHDWSVTWRFRYASGMRGCEMTDVQVTLVSEITLPRWVGRGSADPALVEEWDAFVATLGEHEHGHRRIAYRAAAEVGRELRRMSRPSCGSLNLAANRTGRDVLEKYRAQQRDYDAETRHGTEQGAVWRPRSIRADRSGGE